MADKIKELLREPSPVYVRQICFGDLVRCLSCEERGYVLDEETADHIICRTCNGKGRGEVKR